MQQRKQSSKKQVEKKEKFIIIKPMHSILYLIKIVLLALSGGVLLGIQLAGVEQLTLVRIKSIVFGAFIFIFFDLLSFGIYALITKSGLFKKK